MLIVAAELLIAGAGVASTGSSLEALQATTRWSGRFSLLVFSIIFLLYPKQVPQLQQLLSSRFFLMFAVAHGIHLAELLTYVFLADVQLVPYRLAGGFVAYLMIFAMPWVEEKHLTRTIADSRFQMLGYVYLFYVWFIFFMTYIGRLTSGFEGSTGSRQWQVVLMCWVCLMLGAKLAGVVFSRQTATQKQTP